MDLDVCDGGGVSVACMAVVTQVVMWLQVCRGQLVGAQITHRLLKLWRHADAGCGVVIS